MKFVKKYPLLFIATFIVTMIIKPEVCFIELGVLLLFLVIFSSIIFFRIKKHGIQCSGKIVGFNTDREGSRIPIVQFTTQSGRNIEAEPFIYAAANLSKLISHTKYYETDISLKYDPGKPDRFLLTNQTGFNFLFLGLIAIVGLVFLLIGLGGLLNYISFS